MRELSSGPGELAIRFKIWQARNIVPFGIVAAVCVALVVYHPGAYPVLFGPPLVFLMACLQVRGMLLEVTSAVVRARQGGWRGLRDLEVDRAEVYEIHYRPRRIVFQGLSGRPLMESYPLWTLEQVIQVAEVLDVPVYDHRGRFSLKTLGAEDLAEGRLVKGDSSAGWWS